jgi:hypothetical protein
MTMNKLVIPAQIEDRFHHFTQTVEVCNDTGSVLGQFTPIASTEDALPAKAKVLVQSEDPLAGVASDQQTVIRVLHFWQC